MTKNNNRTSRDVESELRFPAGKLRLNSEAAECKHVRIGVVFLKPILLARDSE